MKLGDAYPRFNELVLWGKRVRGIEAYLKFGFFNLEFAHGETKRKIPGIPLEEDSVIGDNKYFIPNTDSLVTSSTGIYKYGTFKQSLLAIRPSFGSGKNFQFGLSFVKAHDCAYSLTTQVNVGLRLDQDDALSGNAANCQIGIALFFPKSQSMLLC